MTISLIFKLGFPLVPQFRRNRSESRANAEGTVFARCRARINGPVNLVFSRRRLIVLKGFTRLHMGCQMLLKPLKRYATGLLACISFAPNVRSGRKLLPGAIVIAKTIAIERRYTNSHFVVDASAETAGAD